MLKCIVKVEYHLTSEMFSDMAFLLANIICYHLRTENLQRMETTQRSPLGFSDAFLHMEYVQALQIWAKLSWCTCNSFFLYCFTSPYILSKLSYHLHSVNICKSLMIFMSMYIKSNTFTVALLFYFCARLIENSL